MSKRNFILLIIVLGAVIIAVFGFLYFRKPTTPPEGDTGGTNFFSQFNPFGASKPATPTITPPINVSEPETVPEEETLGVKLRKVSSMPVAGFTVFIKERIINTPLIQEGQIPLPKTSKITPPKTEFIPALRYVEKARGIIYQTFADKIIERKFSNTIIPKIYDAYFGNKGENVIMRYLKGDDRTIETFIGNLPKESLGDITNGDKEIKGSFLPENVQDISVSPDTKKIFYLFDNGENIVGTVLNFIDKKKVQIFDSPFTEWLSIWQNEKIITLSTKPSGNASGYMYTVDGSGKNLNKILGNINGFTTLSGPDGKLILYGDNSLSLYLHHTDTRNSDVLGVRTLPEKCVWGKANDIIYCAVPKSIDFSLYPDAWYQGEVSFNDQIWKLDAKNRNATLILDPATAPGGEEIDGIKLAMDEGENYLFFVNKKDSFLWELNLK